MLEIENLKSELNGYNTWEKRKTYDEVFTPFPLIQEILDKIDISVWSDPEKKWLDPCAGLGNFSVFILEKLMKGLEEWEPNEELRKKHILENMLYHVEMNPESVEKLQRVLNSEGKFKLNIKCSDFLIFNKPVKKSLF